MSGSFFIYAAVMAAVTYLIRMLPLVLCKKKIQNAFVQQFLFYLPYAVLGAMTFPAMGAATASVWSALAGLAVAVAVAYFKQNLLLVATAACVTVFLAEGLLRMSGLVV